MTIDWSKAPKGAEFYALNSFYRTDCGLSFYCPTGAMWFKSSKTVKELQCYGDYCERPQQWPETDERISAIAQNGNTGEHYSSPKHDSGKPRYDLLPPIAIDLMAQVMTFGAKKYKPEGWRTVDNAIQRYQAALLRHSFAMLRGEVLDPESGLPHAAHAMCCAAFIAELQGEK
jgi:hypothetical protein